MFKRNISRLDIIWGAQNYLGGTADESTQGYGPVFQASGNTSEDQIRVKRKLKGVPNSWLPYS